MNADQFCSLFEATGRPVQSIDDVIAKWTKVNKSRVPDDFLGHEILIGLLVADSFRGDGLLDQISPEVLAAFTARRGEHFDTYDEVRAYLDEIVARGDHSVLGVINMIKGQIGELVFRDQAGGHAYLANLTNQEAWDVAIPNAHGATEYIQVKIYESASKAVKKMLEIQQKLDAKTITDGGSTVEHINFAVNENIASAVRREAAQHSQLAGMKVYAIPISDHNATQIVADSFDNVGPHAIEHFFGQILGASVSAVALHSLANAFLVYKGSKTIALATEETVFGSAISSVGVAAAHVSAWVVQNIPVPLASGHPIITAVMTGLMARSIAKQWLIARERTLDCLTRETIHLSILTNTLAKLPLMERQKSTAQGSYSMHTRTDDKKTTPTYSWDNKFIPGLGWVETRLMSGVKALPQSAATTESWDPPSEKINPTPGVQHTKRRNWPKTSE